MRRGVRSVADEIEGAGGIDRRAGERDVVDEPPWSPPPMPTPTMTPNSASRKRGDEELDRSPSNMCCTQMPSSVTPSSAARA